MTSARAAALLTPGDTVVVIGAGPAGLTAAHLLRHKDVHVVVLEADGIVGGIARTVEYKGFRFDIGGHRFFTRIEPVERLWEEILGEDFLTVPRLSRIYYNGRFFDYPLKPFNALHGLGLWKAIRIVLSYVHARLDPSPVEENFEQWVTNRFGAQLYEVFFKTYTEKVLGYALSRDQRRVGGPAYPGDVARESNSGECPTQPALDEDQEPHPGVPISPPRSRSNVGTLQDAGRAGWTRRPSPPPRPSVGAGRRTGGGGTGPDAFRRPATRVRSLYLDHAPAHAHAHVRPSGSTGRSPRR